MRIIIKYCTNLDKIEQNEIMIKQALHHNQFNAFSKVEVPGLSVNVI